MNGWITSIATAVESLRHYKRSQTKINAWFFVQEIKMHERENMLREGLPPDSAWGQAELLCRTVAGMPLTIPEGSVFAGLQDGAFSASYALINPQFRVENFAGYCDPCAIYRDISPEGDLTPERIRMVRDYWENTSYVRRLRSLYRQYETYTEEVAFFMEPVTGHTVPDLRPFLREGVLAMRQKALDSDTEYGKAMARSLDAVLILAERYRMLAQNEAAAARKRGDADAFQRLQKMAATIKRVPAYGAATLHEAIQMFTLLWQTMVLEQAPNPYAFSVGNLDRILCPYGNGIAFEEAVALIRHLLCFFQVGSRCWAISQNIMVGGRDADGADQTNFMTDVVLEAFFRSNDPQPALSLKVHVGTPQRIYEKAGAFFFTPGHSTPSLFNDDSLLPMMQKQGVAHGDLADYAIAGCQEPLTMGKASLNTTNTWLNLGKVLELALNDGASMLSGKKIGPDWKSLGFNGADEAYANIDRVFYAMLSVIIKHMAAAGNACTRVLGEERPTPLTSSLMDSFYTFRDMRNPDCPGTRYNGSGCLLHGLGVVADSLLGLRGALEVWSAQEIRHALTTDFSQNAQMLKFLLSQPKYANGDAEVDSVATELVGKVSDMISSLRTSAGKPFLADWSTPSTHLLYGYWVGATPDGRRSRQMLGYGIDPRPEASISELPERFLSWHKLPYHRMTGGYASHIGICPADDPFQLGLLEKALWIRDRVVRPLFRLGEDVAEAPFYVYFNIDTADHLRTVLKEPAKHAPSGCYIMRIHGTFVNFLDLSPAIQEDIIRRLEAGGRAA